MSEEQTVTEEEVLAGDPILTKQVVADSPLKELILYWVGTKKKPTNDEITVDMIVQVLSEEFPEFVMALAQENFLRGYEQALTDRDTVEQMMKEQESEQETDD